MRLHWSFDWVAVGVTKVLEERLGEGGLRQVRVKLVPLDVDADETSDFAFICAIKALEECFLEF